MIAKMIAGFVVIMVGVNLVKPISDAVNEATNPSALAQGSTGSMTGSISMLRFVPGFFALAVLGIGIWIAYSGLKDIGVIGGTSWIDKLPLTKEQKLESKKKVNERLLFTRIKRYFGYGLK